jgi:hypothetical protein
MVDEQVDLWPVVLDVPPEHLGVGGLEHHILEPHIPRDVGDDIGAPGLDLLGYPSDSIMSRSSARNRPTTARPSRTA